MGSLTKQLIGKEDCDVSDTDSPYDTFSRLTSTGSTMTMTSFPDIWKTAQGAVNALYYGSHDKTGATLTAAVGQTVNNTCKDIYVEAGEWVIDTDYDWSTYTTVRWIFASGAYLSIATGCKVTFPFPDSIIAAPTQQIFSGAGTVAFSSPGDIPVGWFGAKGDCTTAGVGTDDYAAIQAAITCARKTHDASRRMGSAITFEPKRYLIQTGLFAGQNATTDSKGLYRIKGNGATIWGKTTDPILDYTGLHGKKIENLNLYGDSSTTPYCGLLLARRDSSTSAGQTTLKNCWILGAYTVAALVNYASEEFDMDSSHIDIDDGEFAAVFTDTGYYYDSAGAWQQLTLPNADSDPGAVSSIDYYIRRCRFSSIKAVAGPACLIQLVGASSFILTESYLNDTLNTLPHIQILGDAANGGAGCYNFNAENNTFHSTKAIGIEFLLANAFNPKIRNNRWGTCSTANVYVNGVNLYDADIEADTLDASTAGSDIFGSKLTIHTALTIVGSLDGEVLLDDAATLTLTNPALVTAKIHRQGYGWQTISDPDRWDGTLVTTSGTGEDDLMSLVIPAGFIQEQGAIRIIGAGNIGNEGGTKTIKLYLTDDNVPTTQTATLIPAAVYTTADNWYFDVTLQAGDGAQAIIGFATMQDALNTIRETGWALDLSTQITVKVTGECSDAGDTIRQHLLKIIPY